MKKRPHAPVARLSFGSRESNKWGGFVDEYRNWCLTPEASLTFENITFLELIA